MKFCKTYKNVNYLDVKTLIWKYNFFLKSLNCRIENEEDTIKFKRIFKTTTNSSGNKYEGAVLLRSGKIHFVKNDKNIKVCWNISVGNIWFRAFLFSLLFSSINYYSSPLRNINNSLLIFGIIFTVISIISFILLLLKIYEINSSAFYKPKY